MKTTATPHPKLSKLLGLLLFLAISAPICSASAKIKIPCSLDSLVNIPSCWKMTPEMCEKQFTHKNTPLYRWLTKGKTRLKLSRHLYPNAEIDLQLFDNQVSVEEVIADFDNGKLNLITFSIYNRGDGGSISRETFKKLYMQCGKSMSQTLKVRPTERKPNRQQGLQTAGYFWRSSVAIALLEHNEGALESQKIEFLRLRISRKGAKGGLATAMLNSRGGAAVHLSTLKQFVKKDKEGNVYIQGIPMVDQGSKGYCVVASVQRLFEHYGIGADMHQIAAIANADPNKGTNVLSMAKELDKIDYRFKTRLKIIAMQSTRGLSEVIIKKGEYFVGKPVDIRKFYNSLKKNINNGIPLLWSLQLGMAPENPPLGEQTNGGHMRLIIGYNEKKGTIIFSDSWGAGHEFKTIKLTDAFRVSKGLFSLKPTLH